MSNEKREQEMMAAADAYVEESEEIYNIVEAITDFCAGWRAADSHPAWVSVKNELPKHDADENGIVSFPIVLVCLYDGYMDTSYYDDIGEGWGDYDGEVEYWMPLPQPPVKKGGEQ